MNRYVLKRVLTEEEVLDASDALFRGMDYAIIRQPTIRSWRPELVAVKGNEVVIVETKGHLGELRKAVAQTALYATDASAAYLALPSQRSSPSLRGLARTVGIGLIEVNERARFAVKAPKGAPRPAFLLRARRAVGKSAESDIRRRRPRPAPLGRVLRHRRIVE